MSTQVDEEKRPLGVAVITPVGTFPSDEDYRRVFADEKIKTILEDTAKAQHLTNTADWVVKADERTLDPEKTYRDENLTCVVEIEWHKPEGGGGA